MRHRDTGNLLEHHTSLVVASTGYRERKPTFLEPIEPLLRRDARGRYRVRLDYSLELDERVSGRLFVVNAELHTHGVATPDLGISAYRNATILNTITGREAYRLPRHTAYSTFRVPEARSVSPALDARHRSLPERRASARTLGHDVHEQLGS